MKGKKKPAKGKAGFSRRLQLLFAALKKELQASGKRELLPKFAFAAGAVLVAVIAIFLLTNKNAYSVQVGGEEVCIIKKSRKVTAEELLEEAVKKIESEMGTAIEVNEEITFKKVHASSKEMQSPDLAIIKISDTFTYLVEAVSLKIEGTEMAIVKNRAEAEEIERALMQPYLPDGVTIVDKGFVENYTTSTVYAPPEDIISLGSALEILATTTPTLNSYTVISGDTLSTIATRYSMTLEQLLALNPNYGMNTTLNVGDLLTIQEARPILSVQVIIEEVQTEVEYKTEHISENPSLTRGYRKVIQYGSDGQAEVTYHVTRVNGIVVDKSEISRRITVEPVAEIIEVGTK